MQRFSIPDADVSTAIQAEARSLRRHSRARGEAGVAYVAMLFLLVILVTLGLAFLLKAGTEASVTMSRSEGMQAEYLAESAANHALWRMLNEPGFPASEDDYYMHSLDGGRYGYKVRRPGAFTFATIATVGAVGQSAVQQSYVPYLIHSNVFTAYPSGASAAPASRRMVGPSLSAPGATIDVGSSLLHWTLLQGCPIRQELVMATVDGGSDINVAVWNGIAWGNLQEFSTDAATSRCVGIAYESQSGDALAVFRNGWNATVYFNLWDGTAWGHATPQVAFSLDAGQYPTAFALASCPGNDDILIAVATLSNFVYLARWNGSAFTNLGVLDTSMSISDHGFASIAYERQSGDALVMWPSRGAMHYRIWNGASLSAEQTVPGFTVDTYLVQTASDPGSDHIALAAVDKFDDIQLTIWNGSTWSDFREIEIESEKETGSFCFDVAWEADGEDLLTVWGVKNATRLRALTWRKGTTLASRSVFDGPDCLAVPWTVQLLPLSASERILVLAHDFGTTLRYSLWTGAGFKGNPAPLIDAANSGGYGMAETLVARSGGIGAGVATPNQPPTVGVGDDQTIMLPISAATLDATVSDDGLPGPPAAVTVLWSVISGPGAVTFGDATQVDTTAEFVVEGDYVLRLTVSDGALSAFDEITVTVDAPPGGTVVASYGSDVLVSISESGSETTIMNNDPKFRLLESQEWTGEALMISNFLGKTNWLDLEGCLIRKEVALGAFDVNAQQIRLAIWDGTAWGALMAFSDESIQPSKCFDMAYESLSGDLLVVGSIYPGTEPSYPGDTRYTIWNGTTWTPEPPNYWNVDLGIENTSFVTMRPDPFSDEILAAVVDGGLGYIVLSRWTGSGFVSLGTLETQAPLSYGQCVDIVYEQQSGDALIIWSERSSPYCRYRIWDGATLGAEGSLPTFGDETRLLRACADPMSDQVFLAAYDASNNLETALWNGSAWIDSRRIETSVQSADDEPSFDVAWEGGGGQVIVAWSKSLDSRLGTFQWTKGTALSLGAVASGPDLTYQPYAVKLEPRSASDQLILLASSGNNTLHTSLWDGDTFTEPVLLTSGLLDASTMPFDVAETLLVAPPTPVNVAPSVGAGADSTIYLPTVTASLSGTVSDDGRPSPPGAVSAAWSQVSGPAGVTFADPAASATTATFPGEGVYVLRLSADDTELTAYDEITLTVATQPEIYVFGITMGSAQSGADYYGQATVWIKDESGASVSGALVGGSWSGAVSGTSGGTTATDGKVMLESPAKTSGGTFTITVTGVSKSGCVYNQSLNVESSDTITAPWARGSVETSAKALGSARCEQP